MQLGIKDEDPESRESTQGLPKVEGKEGAKPHDSTENCFDTLTSARSPLALSGSFSTLSGRGFGPSKPFLLFLGEIPRPFPQL